MGKPARRFFCVQKGVVIRYALDRGAPKRSSPFRSDSRFGDLLRSCRDSCSAVLRSRSTAFNHLSCCWSSHKAVKLLCWPCGFSVSAFDQL